MTRRLESSDLSHFLSCAAGYANLVIAERKFGDYLMRTRQRYPENSKAVTTLAGAVAVLSD